MLPKRSKSNSDFMKNQTYNSIKDQLELQNQALLQQRKNIQSQGYTQTKKHGKRKHKKRSQMLYQQQVSVGQESDNRDTFTRTEGDMTNRIRQKIYGVIKMCEQQQKLGSNEFKDIIEAQRQILQYLQDNQSPTKSRSAQKLSRSKMQRISDSNRKSIRNQISSNGFKHMISDDAMELIEEIQRKTLYEIQSLREDKIMLMRKLNHQVKNHNEEKRKRMILEGKVKELEQILQSTGKRYRTASFPGQKNYGKYYQQEQIAQESDDYQDQYQEEADQENQYYPQKPYTSARNSAKKHHPTFHPHQHQRTPNKQTTAPQIIKKQQNPNQINQVPPSYFRSAQSTGGFAAQSQITDEIARLQHQNRKMKQNLSNSQPIYNPLKNQLKNQLSSLQNKLQHYETIINNQSTNGSEDIENLIMNGNNLLNDGHKLMKIRSKPEMRSNSNEYMQEIKFLKSRIQDLKQENKSLEKGGMQSRFQSASKIPSVYTPNRNNNFGSQNYFKSQTPKARSYTNNYESIIQQMRRVTNK